MATETGFQVRELSEGQPQIQIRRRPGAWGLGNANFRDGEEKNSAGGGRRPVHVVDLRALPVVGECASVQGLAENGQRSPGDRAPVITELERPLLSAGILQEAGATMLSPGYSSKFSKMSLHKDLVRVWRGVAHSTCSQGGDFTVPISRRTGGNIWKHFWVS